MHTVTSKEEKVPRICKISDQRQDNTMCLSQINDFRIRQFFIIILHPVLNLIKTANVL